MQALGLTADQVSSPEQAVELDSIGDTHQTAVTLAFFHPNVATIDKTNAPITKSLLGQTPEVQTLGDSISTMQQQGQDFATHVQATNADGSPAELQFTDTSTNPPTVTTKTFTTVHLNRDNAGFVAALKSGVTAGVKGVRDTSSLGTVIDQPLDESPAASTSTWVQSQGVTPQSTPYSPPDTTELTAGGVEVTVKNTGFLSGTHTKTNGTYSDGQVPIRIYNNFVRWMWAYVQYMGADGKNLSLNSDAKWPDTKYSQSLAIVPQVFTVLGIPIWDTNTVDVTLNFPPEAHTARLLYCGLGSKIVGGGWRQYFPDDAYAHRIAPTDEVLTPALVTGILTLGLNVFCLLSDVSIATTWAAIRNGAIPAGPISNAGPATAAMEELTDVIAYFQTSATILTAAESTALAVTTGSETYLNIENGNNTGNMWSVLVEGLGSLIAKLLFSPAAVGQLLEKVADWLSPSSASTGWSTTFR